MSRGRHVLLERLDRRVVAAGLEADRNRNAGEVGRRSDRGIGGNEDTGRGDRIDVGIELGVAVGGRDVHGPVAGAADVGLAPLLDALEGALVDLVVVLALGRADQLAEFVVETFGAKIALFLGDPLLQPKMRFDDELAHGGSSRCFSQAVIDGTISPGGGQHHVRIGMWNINKRR